VTRSRRQFSPEFKEEAIRMVLEGERTVASVAREFDINAGTLGSWVNRHRIVNAQEEREACACSQANHGHQERVSAAPVQWYEIDWPSSRNRRAGDAQALKHQGHRYRSRSAVQQYGDSTGNAVPSLYPAGSVDIRASRGGEGQRGQQGH
jgi:transposase-like protein